MDAGDGLAAMIVVMGKLDRCPVAVLRESSYRRPTRPPRSTCGLKRRISSADSARVGGRRVVSESQPPLLDRSDLRARQPVRCGDHIIDTDQRCDPDVEIRKETLRKGQ